jgi:glycosyltransferase involved in cell wall biosynthesis
MNRTIYCDADRIVVLGDSMKRRLVEKMADNPSFDPEKVVVIQNWEDEEAVTPKPKSESEFAAEYGTREKFTLVYGGNIGRFHELRTAVEAIERIEADDRTDIQFIIIGEGAQKQELIEYVDEHGIENVIFAPIQPVEKLTDVLNCGNASLVSVKNTVKGMCVSSKFYSSLAIGDPILAIAPEGDEISYVVTEAECGAHVEPGEVEQTRKTLERWADNHDHVDELGRNARQCLVENYTLEHAVEAYTDLFHDVLNQT